MEEHRKHWGGYVLATFLHFASYFNIIFVNNFLFMGSVAGMKARSVVSALIYRKVSQAQWILTEKSVKVAIPKYRNLGYTQRAHT